jgi:rubrerythrin
MKLIYSRDEIMAEHAYAKPQIEAGYRLHGGFDANGTYISPRTLRRWPAVEAWGAQLKTRGFPLIDASVKLLRRSNYPSPAQQKVLLAHGLGQTLWNSLTITGVIEARGGALCDVVAPNFQDIVVEDLTNTCTGHLNKGLLHAHGLDEAGDKARGQGGHDDMWFAVRDALFGKDAYPFPEIPESLSRPEKKRHFPQISADHEGWILLLMNVLMIEVRAEKFFAYCCEVMRDPDNFRDRRAAALHAAELVERIRTDEAIHVGYLQAFVSELRSFTFKAADGSRIPGHTLIDPVWESMIEWHAVTQADEARAQTRTSLKELVMKQPQGERLLAQLDAIEAGAMAAE